MKDTPKEVEDRFKKLIMDQSPARRLAMASDMFDTARALVRAGILDEAGGEMEPEELREKIFLRFYGKDFTDSEKKKIVEHLRRV